MSNTDDTLLARLNALKPSTVSLDQNARSPAVDVEVAQPQSAEDRLAARLKSLRSGQFGRTGPESSTTRWSPRPSAPGNTDSQSLQPAKDLFQDWQSGNDDRDVEDLLAELGPDDQWKLDPNDPKDIESLLKEAKDALSPPDQVEQTASDEPSQGANSHAEPSLSEPAQNEDAEDAQRADEYVQKVLAELDLEQKYGAEEPNETQDTTQSGDGGDSGPLNLPVTPSKLLDDPPASEPPTYEDSELEARFSKLGLDLPSTPTAAPSSKAKASAKAGAAGLGKAQAKSNLPVYTDEDIDSWCCICNEDGEVRCLGCDGDIYCQPCWADGHGNGPGQERGHRAVQYTRKPPTVAAAA